MEEICYHRVQEPNMSFISLEIPENWHMEGGAYSPVPVGTNIQYSYPKLDLKISDTSGKVWIRLLPSTVYFDPTGQMPGSLFGYPVMGSEYNSMVMLPFMDPFNFISNIVIPYLNPGHSETIRFIGMNHRSDLVNNYCRLFPQGGGLGNTYAGGDLTWEEKGSGERLVQHAACILERAAILPGVWDNVFTYAMSAPSELFDSYKNTFSRILGSVEFSTGHIKQGEAPGTIEGSRSARGNAPAAQPSMGMWQPDKEQTKKILEMQAYANKINQEIADHRSKTNEEIMKGLNDTFYR